MSFERWQGRSPLEAYPVSIGLLGTCAVLFVATDLAFQGDRGEAIKLWGMDQQLGYSRGELWRPITSMFLHADFKHVLLNLYALLQLCPALEASIGSGRFSAIYFGAGLAGSLASLAFEPASLGASGALCGILATFVRFERVRLGSFKAVLRDPVGSQFLVWLVFTIAFGFMVPRISNAGHIGGAIGGWAVSAALVPALDGRDRGRLSIRPSLLRSGFVLVSLLALAVVNLRPVWSADYCVRSAALASEQGDPARALKDVRAARRAPLARDPNLFFALGFEEQEKGRDVVAEALYELADEAGYPGEELGHNHAILIYKRGDNEALLAHLRKWQGRGGLPAWQSRLLELEAMEARGELKR